MQWAADDPARFTRERAELERLSQELTGLQGVVWRLDPVRFLLQVDFDLNVHGKMYEARLTYPDLFPATPPYICPRDPSARWSPHQYGPGGALCLEWRADNWNPAISGADLIRSAYKLLASETHPEHPVPVASAHRLTLGQETRGSRLRLLLTPGNRAALESLTEGAAHRLHVVKLLHPLVTILLVTQIDQAGTAKSMDVPFAQNVYYPVTSLERLGRAYRSSSFDQLGAVNTATQLYDALRQAGFDDGALPSPEFESGAERSVLLLGADVKPVRAFELTSDDGALEYDLLQGGDYNRRQPSEYIGLSQLRVGIVGLGSLGSKVTLSLGRCGLRRFLLVDDDLLLPENLSRHELGWAAVGLHKVDAVAEALRLIAPQVEVCVRRHHVAGQESSTTAAAALQDLAQCDLLIDATADQNVFVRLAAVAVRCQRPLVWGELFATGLGGHVARARPGHDPAPLGVRDSLNRFYASQPPAPYRLAAGYDGEEHDPVTAFDCEVGQIASMMTQLTLDTALQRIPSRFPYSAYVMGFRREWIFNQPFETHPVEVSGPDWGASAGETVSEEERRDVLLDLIKMLPGQDADANAAG